jgi:hypothetical protein
MTGLHESVYLRFRGRTRSVPLLAIATVLRRDAAGAATALDILINGPPEARQPVCPSSPPDSGEGGKGGGERSETSGSETFNENFEKRSETERSERKRSEPTDVARRFAVELSDEENVGAIHVLVDRYPAHVLEQALRLTLAVPPHRVRSSRGAIFTGIVRKLAAASKPTHP